MKSDMNSKLIWITGLSGAGKTTVAVKICEYIKKKNPDTIMIDGDAFREIIGNDLGHDLADRIKNAWRIVKMCQYICDQNINVVCSTMSLYAEIHSFIYKNFNDPLIVYLDVSMNELKKRNKKNLYSSGRNVSGIDLPYDEPKHKKYVVKVENSGTLDITVKTIIERLNNDVIS
jgi:adenylylsulfate kinase